MSTISKPIAGQDTVRINVMQEGLAVDKRVVDTGRGVRVHKSVQTHPVLVEETLASEEITVRHVPIDRTLGQDEAMPGTRYDGDVLIVPVFEEIVVVERRIRIKEELHITRISRQAPFSQTVMLQSEQVNIERFDEEGES
jgi:stress response protein YsnF